MSEKRLSLNEAIVDARRLSRLNYGREVVVVYNEVQERYQAISANAKEIWYGDTPICYSTLTGAAV